MSLPVYGGLPKSIIEAIEEVEEHRPDIAMVSPVSWDEGGVRDGGTGIDFLVGIATSPDDHGEDEKRDPRNLGSKATANTLDVEKVTQDGSGNDFGKVVQETIQGLGASGEVGAVDTVLLVGVEPVRRPEHGEQEDDKGLEADRFPQSDDSDCQLGFFMRTTREPSDRTTSDALQSIRARIAPNNMRTMKAI